MSEAITPESIVQRIMVDHPATVHVFLRNRMHCPGCVMSQFMTLAEAAESYGIALAPLVAEMDAARLAEDVNPPDRRGSVLAELSPARAAARRS